ncbi:MFS transporter [Pseudomonas putida]|uniref:MFS transporter n=1 Tax=Pseudomonas putida TaxID=303 RepID=UPI00236399D3|nr:MFS transporter [Pseudomonas putida]MDD2068720.1 MFS transporter [Pseudomonas putida]HDS1738653.1 MFS transporter [Pseudomonas putida]
MNKHGRHAAGSTSAAQWQVVVLCALAQNCTMGFAFGSFGPLLSSTEEHFGVSRSIATMGMSITMLAIGALSPFLGNLLQHIAVRTGMMLGLLLSAAGYWGLALTNSFGIAIVMFGLIGIGTCLAAILGPLTLVSRWFKSNRGRMLSLINLPIMMLLTPYFIAALLPEFGRLVMLAGLGSICLVLALLMLLLIEHPPVSIHPNTQGTEQGTMSAESMSSIFRRPAFWLLSLGIGIMAGSGTGFVVHIVPFGISKDLTLQGAAGLLSVYAAAGIAGTLLFGWLCDRIGPPAALVLSASSQAVLWWGFLHVDGVSLYGLAAALGVCIVPLVMLHGAAISQMFDAASVSRAMGYSYSIKLPFIFGFAPGMGLLFERFGNYDLPFLLTAILLAAAGLSFYLMLHILRRDRSTATART